MKELLLKILSGPQTGAEALLRPGEHVLGRSDQCDLILTDAAMTEKHVRLYVGPKGLEVAPLDGPVLVQGQPLEGKKAVANFALITIGGTLCCCGPAGEPWPNVALESLVKPGGEKAEPKAPAVAASAPAPADGKQGKKTAAKQPASAPAGATKSRSRLPVVLVVLALCVATAVIVWWLVRGVAPESAAAQAAGLLRSRGIRCWTEIPGDAQSSAGKDRGLAVSQDTGAAVVVRGLVMDEAARERVRGALKDIAPPVKFEIRTLPEIATSIRNEFAKQKIHLRVQPEGFGAVRIKGFVNDGEARERIAKQLKTLTPEALQVRWSAVDWSALAPAAEAALARQQLAGLTLQPKETQVTVAGEIRESDLAKWDAFCRDLDNAFAVPIEIARPALAAAPVVPKPEPLKPETPNPVLPPPPVVLDPVAATTSRPDPRAEVVPAQPGAALALSIKGVAKVELQSPRRFQSSEGTWYDEGSVLKCGYLVKEVFRDGAVLTRGEEAVIFTVQDKPQ